MIATLVTNPREFFGERIKYRGARTQGYITLIVGIAFVAQHIGAYVLLGDVAVDLYEVIFLHSAIFILAPFALWIGSTILIVFASRIVMGKIRYGDVFRLTGWGLLPLIAAGLVQSIARIIALRGVAPPDLGLYSYIAYEWDQYREYIGTALNEPVFLVATLIGVLFALYTALLWSMAVEEIGSEDGFSVNRTKAGIIVVVPFILTLGWILFPYLF